VLRWKKGQAVGGNYVSVGGHQGGKTAKNGLGNAASGISASSANTNLAHGHSINSVAGRLWIDYNSAGGSGYHRLATNGGYYYNVSNPYYAEDNLGNHLHSISGTAAAQTIAGDTETRPTNRGVRYIIKA
jgi:hypothetical protein